MATLGEWAVAGKMQPSLRLSLIDEFIARCVRSVEWNEIACHCCGDAGLASVVENADLDGPNWLFSLPESTVYPDVFEAMCVARMRAIREVGLRPIKYAPAG
jgi:hypothetical protein